MNMRLNEEDRFVTMTDFSFNARESRPDGMSYFRMEFLHETPNQGPLNIEVQAPQSIIDRIIAELDRRNPDS